MVYLIGQEYQHLHDTVAFHCLNMNTIEDYKVVKKTETEEPLTVYALVGGMEKPIFTVPTIEQCISTLESLVLQNITKDPYIFIDVAKSIKPQLQSGDDVIKEVFEVLKDVGRADLVNKFVESLNETLATLEEAENITEITDTVPITIDSIKLEIESESPQLTEEPSE